MQQISFRINEKTWTFYLDSKRKISDVFKYIDLDPQELDSLFALKRQCIIDINASIKENKLEDNEIVKVRLNA